MIRNYYNLKKLTKELLFLCGSVIVESFTQEKDVLVIRFYNGEESFHLQFSTDTRYGSIILKENFARARSNSSDLFGALQGKKLINLHISENDRIIQLDFAALILKLYFFGGAGNCAVLMNCNSEMLDSFKLSPSISEKINIQNLRNNTALIKDNTLLELILNFNNKFGKDYANEICHRLLIPPSEIIDSKDNILMNDIFAECKNFEKLLLESNEFYILRDASGKNTLSLVRLKNYPEIVKSFNYYNKALGFFISSSLRDNSVFSLKKSLTAGLQKTAVKLENKLKSFSDERQHIERSEKYYLFGSLLSSVQDIRAKSGKSIILSDWEGKETEIPLKQELNLLENSIRYFEKSKNIQKAIENNRKQKPLLESKLSKINSLQNRINITEKIKDINRIMDENRDIAGFTQNEETGASTKYRQFDLGEGFILYVGKNAANNDELTMHFAKPNDIWMHARGSSGSHAVLRINKDQRPPKQILQKAASITAYYSGAKKAKWTPVAYTYKKYVHKPKGANPGSVVISREEVIMAEPKLPENSEFV